MNKLTSLAVAVLATTSMLSVASAVEITPNFGGYVRAGLDHAKHGKFSSWNKNKVGRLGNESDIWGEIALGASFNGAKDTIWGIQTRAAYSNENGEKTDAKKLYLDEYYGTVKNVFSFSKDATIWVGKRYYHREENHMLDWKWYQIEGFGAGVEYMDLGPGKFSFAWFSATDNDFSYDQKETVGWVKDVNDEENLKNNEWKGPDGNKKSYFKTDIVTEKFDVEYGLTPWDGAWLNFRSTLLLPEVDDNKYMEVVKQPKFSNGNIFAVSLDNYYSLGSCKTVVQFIKGPNSASPFGNGSWIDYWNAEAANESHRWQFLNYGDMKFGDFGIAHSLYYTVASGFRGDLEDKESDKAFSFAIRPYYKLTDITKITAELGLFTETDTYHNGKSDNYKGQKATLAYVLSPDAGNWKSRPELRFYVTYLHGNHNEALRNSPTQDKAMTIHYKNGVVEKYDHPRDNQVIFGAQLEAWW